MSELHGWTNNVCTDILHLSSITRNGRRSINSIESSTAMNKQNRIGKVEKVVCPHCGTDTKHTILHSYDTHGDDGNEGGVSWGAIHDFMQCNGCETSTLRLVSWCSEDQGDKSIILYPPRPDDEPIRKPRNYENLSYGGSLDSAYRQTISAANQQLRILASAGVRLVIEGVSKHLGVVDGEHFDEKTGAVIKNKKTGINQRFDDLAGRINGMVERDFITKPQADALHQIRFLGNDTAHELAEPSSRLLNEAIDIVEDVLNQIFEQPEKTKNLAARKRPKK